ncbi:uncharacterized protein LOC122344793 [Puntigrus tetrazona]|uniref:uncharacterized protein LOC122344793 n=1 Tax=Puntigrus tetrazona TaxID=1606681 RepID=UPI001C8912FF|nr:uncharacterized protein LOC122344793 [Puntigrus tetrazona]XP_043094300.1 uncharacterized protein LOC122344793 [Puntigrus tetrazona]
MRTGQTSFLLSVQHWIHLLIFFLTLITGVLTDEEVIRALLGGSASLNFKVKADMKVTLAVWKKCPDEKVFVYSPIHGLTIFDNNYAGRLSIKSNYNIILDKIQESDFGTYCYELTTFPDGSLQGTNKLEKATENGDLPIMIISAGCSIGLIVLCGIVTGVVCYKKRKSSLALDHGGPPGSQLKNKKQPNESISSQNEEDFNYLNIT